VQSAAAVSSHDDSRASNTGTEADIATYTQPIHGRCKSALTLKVYFFFEEDALVLLEFEWERPLEELLLLELF